MLRLLIGISVLALSAPVSAQEASSISLEEARARAAASAPSVASSAARMAIAHADTGIAGMLPNPRLGIGGGINYLFVADFFVLLPIFGQREMAEEAASAEERAVQAGVDVSRLDAELAASLAWIDLYAAEHEHALAVEDAARRAQLASVAEGRLEEGAGSRLDVVRTAAEAGRAEAERAALEGSVAAARARLASLLGDRELAAWSTRGAPMPEDARAPIALELDARMETHPVVQRFAASLHAAEAGVERAHRARFPLIGLSISDWVSRANATSDLRVLVTAEIPLFDEPRIERAEAMREAARIDEDGVALGLRAALEATRAEYLAADARCHAEEDEVLPAAVEAAQLAASGYEDGAVDLNTVLLADQGQADAERRVLICQMNRARAWARLRHAMGGFDG